MIPPIERCRAEIAVLCRRYGVRRLDLFGSAAGERFDAATSDFDFVAVFADTTTAGYAHRHLDFAESLEQLLGRPVDVVTERSVKNPRFRQAIEEARQNVYTERDPLVAA